MTFAQFISYFNECKEISLDDYEKHLLIKFLELKLVTFQKYLLLNNKKII